MNQRTRTLLLCMLALCTCTTLVVGGTYALFSDEAAVNIHLAAGKLDIKLAQVAYQACTTNADGILQVGALDETRKDLVASTDKIFNITNAVPTAWYKSTIEIKNDGTVACNYKLQTLWTATAATLPFAKQLKITISATGMDDKVFFLSDCADNDVPFGILNAGDSAEFTILAEFVNVPDNNDAKNIALSFDLKVIAEQVPLATTTA